MNLTRHAIWLAACALLGAALYLWIRGDGHRKVTMNTADPPPDASIGLTPRCAARYRCGYADAGGAFAIPPVYKLVKPFFEGRAAVYVEGSGRGLIDSRGDYVVRPAFAYAGPFSEGLAAVCPDGKNLYHWIYIDRAGRTVIDLKYNVTHAAPFHDGKAWVGSPFLFSSQSREIDRKGKTLLTIRKWN